jgi:2-polyprenyl-6-methoxyphenol hydroxylase-like FAD-dependent oxidoreductase
MVIGADGLYSRTRKLLFPDAPPPEYTGQTCWRLIAHRPPNIQRRTFFLGGPWKVGLSPVSAESMYMFLLQTGSRPPHTPDNELPSLLKTLLMSYGGPLQKIRQNLGPESSIIMRPLEAFLLPGPWYSENTLLVGDAAHPTTPQLASGAGMAVEDALVLADELERHGTVPETFAGFMKRRYSRCRLVVSNSIEIGRLEQSNAPIDHQTRLVVESLATLAQPL